MKSNNIKLYLIMFLFVSAQLFANTNPVVTNVAFSINGTTVTVTYDVVDAEESTITVYMEVSDDGGTTWDFDYGVATGAIGTNITEGTGKAITWTYSGGENTNFKIKILADDVFGDQIYYQREIFPNPLSYEGQDYEIIKIGDQLWFAENLNVGTRINSTTGGSQQTNNSIIEKYCYDNDENNCDTYGGLYEWNEVMQYVTTPGTQGICPSGWRIPTETELKTLTYKPFVGSVPVPELIDQSQTMTNGLTATNTTGFSAMFVGYRSQYDSGNFWRLSTQAMFWTSTNLSSYVARGANMHYDTNFTYYTNFHKYEGFSVRCLKN